MKFLEAKAQCESDGAYLADPRSDAENTFIAGLISGHFWIGINDIDEEGKFVTADGLNVSYTNWRDKEPNNYQHTDGNDEDGVLINWAGQSLWNDQSINRPYKFVCYYRIEGKFFNSYAF